ncbi:MAG TPA: GIY-YIG nuclease family protein [Terriglobales bacterium]|nr:GIY-YIG nuclease family protein [Terriglobales bacterium]
MLNPRCGESDRPKCFYVYIMASANRVLYIGVTNALHRRVWQHKFEDIEGFTKRYKVTKLVHWESFDDVRNAISREKALKGWRREKKVALIEERNPKWKDLAAAWYGQSNEKIRRRFARENEEVLSETGVEPID